MKKASKELIKHINSLSILNLIRNTEEISRADIAKKIGLNPATVSSNTKLLLDQRLIKEIGTGSSSGGRKPVLYRINDKDVYTIGVFINADYVNCGLVNLLGDIVVDRRVYYKDDISFDEVMEIVNSLINEVSSICEKRHDRILGVGIGIHGLVDYTTGRSIHAPALNWKNRDIIEQIQKRHELPTLIDNDCRVMALGEKWFGKARDSKDFILLHIDKGLGAGIYINENIIRGNSFSAGEIGHINIPGRDSLCKCGKTGCLESIISEYGIVRAYTKLTNNSKGLYEIIDMAYAGDKEALQIFEEIGENVGYAMSILNNLLNPEMIVLGGRVSNAYEIMKPSISRAIDKYGIGHGSKQVIVSRSNHDEYLGVIGAATLVMESLLTHK